MDTSKETSGLVVKDTSNGFNDFFYKSEAERPAWLESPRSDEENLLDDVQMHIFRTCSIDSTRSYSRTCSLESQMSDVDSQEMETEVVLRVAMCCGSCENKAKSLTQMEGVTTVVCDRKTDKVTVTGTARPRDVLEACKKLFEQSKVWNADDPIVDDSDPAPDGSLFLTLD